jgi:hypothetical protein
VGIWEKRGVLSLILDWLISAFGLEISAFCPQGTDFTFRTNGADSAREIQDRPIDLFIFPGLHNAKRYCLQKRIVPNISKPSRPKEALNEASHIGIQEGCW